ncbi:HNH endonuclease signature motif containing protein, partial [Actinopolymorpha sp. B11F2]|uniref:HNH endonuclease signature motif containing protein n=1 Tax=Actinopolymorpha sp. B11F2 TaxID=3160862 RepID=UPI0032E3B5D5
MAGTAAARVFVKTVARRIKGEGDGRTLAQIEADVFLDLLRGRNPAATATANPATADPATAADPGTSADQTSRTDPAPRNPHRDPDCDHASSSASGSASGTGADDEAVGDVEAWDAPGDGGACVETGDEHLVAKVELVADLETWLGLGEKAGELAGLGAITPAVIDDIKNAAAGGFEYCRTVTVGGKVVYHQASSGRYKPTAAQRRLIQAMHRTCSQPGCSRPAVACDLDHTIEHRLGGPSCACNLAPLCRRHHRAKHEGGWWWTQNQPGHLTT